MKIENAKKTLAKFGTVETDGHGRFWSQNKNWIVECIVNGRNEPGAEICCCRARRFSDVDESQSDYCAGSFFPTLSKAMKWAHQMIREDHLRPAYVGSRQVA